MLSMRKTKPPISPVISVYGINVAEDDAGAGVAGVIVRGQGNALDSRCRACHEIVAVGR